MYVRNQTYCIIFIDRSYGRQRFDQTSGIVCCLMLLDSIGLIEMSVRKVQIRTGVFKSLESFEIPSCFCCAPSQNDCIIIHERCLCQFSKGIGMVILRSVWEIVGPNYVNHHQENSKTVFLSKFLYPIVDIFWVKAMIAQGQEQATCR
jgi:hypothetical protein